MAPRQCGDSPRLSVVPTLHLQEGQGEGSRRCSEEGAAELMRVNLPPVPLVPSDDGPRSSAWRRGPCPVPLGSAPCSAPLRGPLGGPERGRQSPARCCPARAHGSPNPWQGVKEFKCEVCGREFTLQANMKRHMLIHTSVRPYQCHICFKTFVQKQTLKTHMIVHSPVKPFKCKVRSGVRGGEWTPGGPRDTRPGWAGSLVTGKQFCDASLCSLGQTARPEAAAQSCAAAGLDLLGFPATPVQPPRGLPSQGRGGKRPRCSWKLVGAAGDPRSKVCSEKPTSLWKHGLSWASACRCPPALESPC